MRAMHGIEGVSGELVLMDGAGANGVPVIQVNTTTESGCKLAADEVAELRDALSDWLRDRGRE